MDPEPEVDLVESLSSSEFANVSDLFKPVKRDKFGSIFFRSAFYGSPHRSGIGIIGGTRLRTRCSAAPATNGGWSNPSGFLAFCRRRFIFGSSGSSKLRMVAAARRLHLMLHRGQPRDVGGGQHLVSAPRGFNRLLAAADRPSREPFARFQHHPKVHRGFPVG